MTIVITPSGHLTYQGRTMPCALGKNGITTDKKEGDGKTPAGTWPLRCLFYRADRLPKPVCSLPLVPISRGLGWCDDPASKHYNRLVTLPFAASHETLWREDSRYDLCAVIAYNDTPPRAGLGSAIFLHLATHDRWFTEGCVALLLKDFQQLLPSLDSNSLLEVRSAT